MIKARASGSKVYLYFMKKGRQAKHRFPQNSCLLKYHGLPNLIIIIGTSTITVLKIVQVCFSSSPGRSPGRAIVLPPALSAASALAEC